MDVVKLTSLSSRDIRASAPAFRRTGPQLKSSFLTDREFLLPERDKARLFPSSAPFSLTVKEEIS